MVAEGDGGEVAQVSNENLIMDQTAKPTTPIQDEDDYTNPIEAVENVEDPATIEE